MTRFLLWLALLAPLAVPACSPRNHAERAEDRAARLNDQKSRAAALVADGRYRAALEVLEPLAAAASADYQVFVLSGDAHAALDEFDDAVAAYESALRLSYGSHEAHLKLATLLMKHERVGRALTEFELAIRYGDREALTHYNYGLALREMGRDEEALDEWRRAHEIDPGEARYAEAVAIGLTGVDDEAAVAHFEKAAALGADSPSFHNNFGLALEKLGHYDEAASQFQAAVANARGEEAYAFNLAALWMRAAQYAHAVDAWDDLARRFGPHWSYSVYRARALLSLERYQEAIDGLRGLVTGDTGERDRVPPHPHQALEILALAHRGVGNRDRALEFIAAAVADAPDNLNYRNTYGVILAENGRIDEARAQWRAVLETDENNAVARENLSRFGP